MSGITIERAINGGFYVWEWTNPNAPLVILFAGNLSDCLDFIGRQMEMRAQAAAMKKD